MPRKGRQETKGVYAIVDQRTGHVYLGRAENVWKRIVDHRSSLRRGVHPSRALQRAFDAHGGVERDFLVALIEEVRYDLHYAEARWRERVPALLSARWGSAEYRAIAARRGCAALRLPHARWQPLFEATMWCVVSDAGMVFIASNLSEFSRRFNLPTWALHGAAVSGKPWRSWWCFKVDPTLWMVAARTAWRPLRADEQLPEPYVAEPWPVRRLVRHRDPLRKTGDTALLVTAPIPPRTSRHAR